MTDQHDHHDHTTSADQAFIDGVRRLQDRISGNPPAIAAVGIVAAVILFWLGTRVGQVAYDIFGDDAQSAITFGVILVTFFGAVIGLGVWLDRRKRTRDSQNGQVADDQPEQ